MIGTFSTIMKLIVQVFKEGNSATHKRVPFTKVLLHCSVLKLVKKQDKIIGIYRMQLSTVDSNFLEIYSFNFCREAIPVILLISRVLKLF